VRDGYRPRMSDDKHTSEHPDDDGQQNIQGAPNSGSADADTASGGAPDDSDEDAGDDRAPAEQVDPDTGTDQDDKPIDNPSGG
jgi:hypothetical protein